jgi:hypothetical protein
MITTCYNKNFPLVRISRRKFRDNPWYGSELHLLKHKVLHLFKKWRSTMLGIDKDNYKALNAIYKTKLKQSENEYYINYLNKFKNKLKILWREINKLIDTKNVVTKIDSIYNKNKDIITDGTEIANILNENYINMAVEINQQLQIHNNLNKENHNIKMNVNNKSILNTLYLKPTSNSEIIMILNKMNVSKKTHDKFSVKALKLIINEVVEIFTDIFNYSLENSIVPKILKQERYYQYTKMVI